MVDLFYFSNENHFEILSLIQSAGAVEYTDDLPIEKLDYPPRASWI